VINWYWLAIAAACVVIDVVGCFVVSVRGGWRLSGTSTIVSGKICSPYNYREMKLNPFSAADVRQLS
jgi:hypothetical protein